MHFIKKMVLVSFSNSTKLLTNFKLHPSYQTAYYDIVIQVDTYTSSTDSEYYEVMYSFSFHPPDYDITDEELEALKVELHPFHSASTETSDIRLNQYLGIMLKNTFTEQLIRYLLMDNKTLAQFSGRISPEEYRNSLMWTISYFAKEVKHIKN